MENMSFFLESLARYQFLQNALWAAVLVGFTCGIIGCFIILRGLSLMGDAISHAVLPGVALAYLLGVSLFLGAVVTGVLAALAAGYITRNSKIKEDAAIGIALTAFFALGIVLITALRGSQIDLWHILFGNVLAVTRGDLLMTLGLGIVVLACVLLFYKQLLLTTFDPVMAQAIGMPVKQTHYLLMLLLSLVTVAALQTVGIVLVVAMLITPGATAYLLTHRLSVMLALAALIGVCSSVLGVYVSYMYDTATGASIVLVASVCFFLGFFYSSGKRSWKRFAGKINNP